MRPSLQHIIWTIDFKSGFNNNSCLAINLRLRAEPCWKVIGIYHPNTPQYTMMTDAGLWPRSNFACKLFNGKTFSSEKRIFLCLQSAYTRTSVWRILCGYNFFVNFWGIKDIDRTYQFHLSRLRFVSFCHLCRQSKFGNFVIGTGAHC